MFVGVESIAIFDADFYLYSRIREFDDEPSIIWFLYIC